MGWARQKADRRRIYAQAEAAARRSSKPLLIVGMPDGEYPAGDPKRGDLVVDIRPRAVAKQQGVVNYVQANVEDLSRWPRKHFGACFCSFTISYCCDAKKAEAELHRVADRVFMIEPSPARLTSYLVPARRWIVREGRPPIRLPWNRRCNIPTRYGTDRATAFGEVEEARSTASCFRCRANFSTDEASDLRTADLLGGLCNRCRSKFR